MLVFANVLLCSLWVCIVYSQGHWLERVNFVSVDVDGKPVPASVYIGNPTDSEAEAIILVHVPEVGDYYLNLENDSFREASSRDRLRLRYGTWTFRSMREGRFRSLLPFLRVDECRIPLEDGRILTVNL